MNRGKKIYEGKAKILFEGPEAGTIIQYFKDDATAFNNQKKGEITGKGVLNNRISEFMMKRIGEMGIPTHFMKRLNMREQLVKAVEIVPLEVVIRNTAAGSICKRLGIESGTKLDRTILEWCYKYAMRINDILSGIFAGVGLQLIDFKLEFGRYYKDETVQIILADEISPDSCRLWDRKTGEKLDKDRFREDLGNVPEAYQEVARRLGLLSEDGQVREFSGPRLVT